MPRSFRSWYQRQTFRFKVTFLSTVAAGVAIFIVAACYIFFESGTFKRDLQNEQFVRLNLISDHIADALVRDDSHDIDQALSVFRKLDDISHVIVFTPEAQARNRFNNPNLNADGKTQTFKALEPVSVQRYRYDGNMLVTQVPVMKDSQLVGVIMSRTRLDRLNQTVLNYFIIGCAVFPFALFAAWIIGHIFATRLVEPVVQLGKTMARVKSTNDYDLTAPVMSDNEMGRLAQSFNEMLAEVRYRDQRLETQTKALVAEKEKAEAASHSKTQFLANMSHELRTPMNGILGMTEVLMRSGLKDNQQKFANVIYRSGSALTTIINDILDFSKVEANKLELVEDPFEIRTVITDVTNLLANKAHEKEIEILTRIPDTLPRMAIGDMGRIRQVLTNIIGNAIKFTHEGTVTLSVRSKPENGKLKLSFSVVDTGIGIAPDKVDAVFQKFTQAESSTTRDYGGTGLGLAISKRLVELMGGEIGVRSELGVGSTFWFNILLDAVEDTPTDESTTYTGHYLIISGNAGTRDVLCRQLGQFDALATGCESTQEALRALTDMQISHPEANPVFIIEDRIGEISALSAISQIRKNTQTRDVPVIVMRSDKDPNKTACYKPYAHVRLMFPPITLKALIYAINNMVADKGSRTLMALTGASPAASEESPEPATLTASVNAPQRPRILVAEDQDTNRFVLENLLGQETYDVTFTRDGQAALDTALSDTFDLILMDISMPVMCGRDVMRRLRQHEKNTGAVPTPIIALTAHSLPSDREACLEAGADDFLSKPVTSEQLFKAIHSLLEKPSERRLAS